MNRTPVKSSAIRSLGYEDGMLHVEFPSGVWSMEVTPEEYAAVLASDSIGRAVNALKADRDCTRVQDEPGDPDGEAFRGGEAAAYEREQMAGYQRLK